MKKWLIFAVVLFFCFAGFTSWIIIKSNPEDERDYLELVHPSGRERERTSTQFREDVRKDLYITDKSERLHTVIECSQSNLVITHGMHEAELAEKMRDISCFAQEEIHKNSAPSQIIRFFKADEGVYHYSNNVFEADDARLFRYFLPGNELVFDLSQYNPLMKGEANHIALSFSKGIQFQAEQFHATLFNLENVK